MSASDLIVAIDGPAGSGKSTVARALAARLHATFLDTGAIYRSLALLARRRQVSWDDAAGVTALALNLNVSFRAEEGGQRVLLAQEDVSEAIRTPEMARGASDVSRHAGVRQALLGTQRGFAKHGAVVAEGRDVGTVVFPEATVKVFLSASPEERARRRLLDLRRAGIEVSFAEVLAQQEQRDAADAGRDVAPLKRAEDAVEIDTTGLALDDVIQRIYSLCLEKAGGPA